MRVMNAQGVMRDVVCDIKDCDTQEDVLERYRSPSGWHNRLIEDGQGSVVVYTICGGHSFTKDNPPTADMMKERA